MARWELQIRLDESAPTVEVWALPLENEGIRFGLPEESGRNVRVAGILQTPLGSEEDAALGHIAHMLDHLDETCRVHAICPHCRLPLALTIVCVGRWETLAPVAACSLAKPCLPFSFEKPFYRFRLRRLRLNYC